MCQDGEVGTTDLPDRPDLDLVGPADSVDDGREPAPAPAIGNDGDASDIDAWSVGVEDEEIADDPEEASLQDRTVMESF